MYSILSYCRDTEILKMIEASCKDLIAARSDESMEYFGMDSEDGVRNYRFDKHKIDLMYFELAESADLETLQEIRKNDRSFRLMLMTKPEISPIRYLRPSISPDILIMFPFTRQEFRLSNEELFDTLIESQDTSEEDYFVAKTEDGREVIPYQKILLFEARNKKIYARVGNREYEFYDSIENIMQSVPDYFVRCHRSYIINRTKITRLMLSENLVELSSDVLVPLSRTYRKAVTLQFK